MEVEDIITRKELIEYAKLTDLNLGQAEKDYFQNILLFIIYQAYSIGTVFKGGTALKKCYGLNRFSEDLDFTATEFSAEVIQKGIERFKLEAEIKSKKYQNGLKIMMKIKGHLYTGVPQSMCSIIIDISFRENVILQPVIKTIGRFLEEVPSFDVIVMQEKEILTEKIRALLTRKKARDLYDLWFLINKGVEIDWTVLGEKFKYYNQSWNIREFEAQINSIKPVWNSELKPLVKTIPDFNQIKNLIMSEVRKRRL